MYVGMKKDLGSIVANLDVGVDSGHAVILCS